MEKELQLMVVHLQSRRKINESFINEVVDAIYCYIRSIIILGNRRNLPVHLAIS